MDINRKRQLAKEYQGFTLVELLVVVIIIGVLSAIASPSYLNQTRKVKGAEAKANLGTINRAQQAYRLANNTMASAITDLDAKVNQRFYSYTISPVDANNSITITTTQESDLKAYSSRVQQSGDTYRQLICESNDIVGSGTIADVPTSMSVCPTGYNDIN